MRDFLNGILQYIGTTSLTDDEFDGLTIESYAYDQATYDALLAVLVARDSVSDTKDRLYHAFKAKGAAINETATGSSEIYVGGDLST